MNSKAIVLFKCLLLVLSCSADGLWGKLNNRRQTIDTICSPFNGNVQNSFGNRVELDEETFHNKYAFDLEQNGFNVEGGQAGIYFGMRREDGMKCAFKRLKYPPKNDGEGIENEVFINDYLLNGSRSDMTFGVLPILDMVRYNVGQAEKTVYGFVMPLVGKDLRASLKKARSLDEVKRIAKAGFATLKNIGLKNVTHRDLRPENLAWGLGEHSDILYALDTEMAELYIKDDKVKENKNKEWRGSRYHKSIELLEYKVEQGPIDDIYSLCLIALQQLIGALPWQHLNYPAVDEERIRMIRALDTTEKIVKHMGLDTYLGKNDTVYDMFNGCFDLTRRLPRGEAPKSEWYDEAAKLFE